VRAAVCSALLLVSGNAALAQDAVTAAPHTDADGTVEMRLPAGWAEDDEDPWTDQLVSWRGRLGSDEKGKRALLVVRRQRAWTSALLRLGSTLRDEAARESEDLRRSGDRWVEAAFQSGDPDAGTWKAAWQRCIEAGGQVVVVDLLVSADSPEEHASEAQALLDTVRVLKSPPADVPPKGWTRSKIGTYVVYAEKPRWKVVRKMVKRLAEGRAVIVKALPGKPHDTEAPVVYVYATAAAMNRGARRDGVGRSVPVAHRMNQRPLHAVMGDPVDDERLRGYLCQQAARQYIWQYFGGHVPGWIAVGLGTYAAGGALGSGASKPPNYYFNYPQSRVASSRSLVSWMDVPAKFDDEKMVMEIWAWHFYLRHGKAKAAARKAYHAYIRTLRETGDVRAARRHFDGVDDAALHAAYRKWVQEQ
jgi:hypothetical protein